MPAEFYKDAGCVAAFCKSDPNVGVTSSEMPATTVNQPRDTTDAAPRRISLATSKADYEAIMEELAAKDEKAAIEVFFVKTQEVI